MPKVSPTMTHGVLVSWKKSVGDHFEEDEEIAEVESDKSTQPLRAFDEGYLARILVEEGTSDVPVGKPVGVTVEEENMIAAFKDFKLPDESHEMEDSSKENGDESSSKSVDETVPSRSERSTYNGPMSPALVRLLNQYPNLDLGNIEASGPKGRILKGDVLAAIEKGTAFTNEENKEKKMRGKQRQKTQKRQTVTKAPEENFGRRLRYTDVPLSSMRRTIARRLTEAKQSIPHFYVTKEYELDELLFLRKKLNARPSAPSLSVNDFLIKAAALALKAEPTVNSRWDTKAQKPVSNSSIDISMAVSIPGGLITPIIKNADQKSVSTIAAEAKDLAARAREGRLLDEEYIGGTFSTSNLGMYGVSRFSAVINPPHSGNLAIGGGKAKLLPSDDGSYRKATVGVAQLSADRRVIDEVSAAKFMNAFLQYLSEPEMMIG